MNSYMVSDGKVKISVFNANGIESNEASGISPEFCAMLGCAAGTANCGRIGIGFSGGAAGEAMKNAFAAGVQSTGASVVDFGAVMESEAVFAISALGLNLSAYITSGPQSSVRFLGVGGIAAPPEVMRSMDEIISGGTFRRCCWNEYRPSADISGIKLLYRRELYSGAPNGLAPMCARPVCDNPVGEALFADILCQLGCNTAKGNIFRLSSDGLSLTIEDSVAGVIGPKRVSVLSCGAEFERHNDVSVPENAPPEIEELAKRYSRKVYRYGNECSDNVMARAQYRMRDGIMTAIRIMAFMRERNMTLEQMDMHF